MAMAEVEDAGYRDLIPAGIVITGGTALLNGITEFVQERYDIPVRRGKTPQGIHGLRDIVESPIYATAIGLLKYTVESKEYYFRDGLRWPGRNDRRGTLFGRILRWLAQFFKG